MNAPDPSRLNPPEAAAGRRGGFVRSVMVLVSGTALAHGITAAAMPILSRLYSPADFGLLAVFSACLGIVSAVACLRFELAIALADLLWLSVLCCLVISAVLALPALLAPAAVAHSLGQPALAPFVGLLPLGFLLAGCYSALQFWHVREKHFGWLAKTRIGQSAGSAGAQIGMGVASAGPIGLLIGQRLISEPHLIERFRNSHRQRQNLRGRNLRLEFSGRNLSIFQRAVTGRKLQAVTFAQCTEAFVEADHRLQ